MGIGAVGLGKERERVKSICAGYRVQCYCIIVLVSGDENMKTQAKAKACDVVHSFYRYAGMLVYDSSAGSLFATISFTAFAGPFMARQFAQSPDS